MQNNCQSGVFSITDVAQSHSNDALLKLGFQLLTYTYLHIVTKFIICVMPLSAFYIGQEYPAIVEFAPFQKVSKKKLKKKDAKAGSIEEGICDKQI